MILGATLFPSPRMIPDRSSPSRVRFAASRPGRLRADPKGWLFMREKGGKSFFCYLQPLAFAPPQFAVSLFVSVLYL